MGSDNYLNGGPGKRRHPGRGRGRPDRREASATTIWTGRAGSDTYPDWYIYALNTDDDTIADSGADAGDADTADFSSFRRSGFRRPGRRDGDRGRRTDTLAGIETVCGEPPSRTPYTEAPAAQTLLGLGGADTLVGGGGADLSRTAARVATPPATRRHPPRSPSIWPRGRRRAARAPTACSVSRTWSAPATPTSSSAHALPTCSAAGKGRRHAQGRRRERSALRDVRIGCALRGGWKRPPLRQHRRPRPLLPGRRSGTSHRLRASLEPPAGG